KRANFGIFIANSVLAFHRHPEKQLYRYSITMLTDGTAHDHRAVNIVTRSGGISFLQSLLLVRSISDECDGPSSGHMVPVTGLEHATVVPQIPTDFTTRCVISAPKYRKNNQTYCGLDAADVEGGLFDQHTTLIITFADFAH
ncbi:hypothetical protein PoB_006642600, partial [Plakobranchus ocellatus]